MDSSNSRDDDADGAVMVIYEQIKLTHHYATLS